MSRVRLFPGFSTAVLQTGPPTFGVRLKMPKLNFVYYMRAMHTHLYVAVVIIS
jgi:hypothetical protein